MKRRGPEIGIRVLYDATSNTDKVAGTITKTNSGTWKKATFTVTDAYFGKRMSGGSDIALYANGNGDTTFHMLEVVINGKSQPPPPPVPIVSAFARPYNKVHLPRSRFWPARG